MENYVEPATLSTAIDLDNKWQKAKQRGKLQVKKIKKYRGKNVPQTNLAKRLTSGCQSECLDSHFSLSLSLWVWLCLG